MLFNAGPLDITYAKMTTGINAILEVFFPAQSTGAALYEVLTNSGYDSVPAARLPATWPTNINQVIHRLFDVHLATYCMVTPVQE